MTIRTGFTIWGKMSVGWYRVYGPDRFFRVGTWQIVFFSIEGCLIPTKTAVVNDFGDLVEVPA